MADLDGVRAKFGRACKHADDFDSLLSAYVEADSYEVTFKFEPETGWHHFNWKVNAQPPGEQFALIFGDMLYNLRASLDYIAWQLVLLAGSDPTDHTAFPAAKTAHGWASAKGQVAGIEERWVTEIDNLQPYKRADRPEIHPLAILDYVNNIHKHRLLVPALMTAEVWTFGMPVEALPTGSKIDFRSSHEQPMRDGAELFRFRVETGEELNVDMDEKPPLRVAFRDGLNFDWKNRDLIEWVGGAIAVFEPAFSS
jgi:hypothetical protein